MKRWYVIYTHPGAEGSAEQHLRRQGFEVYLPRNKKRRSHARKITWVVAPLFPRYLFVSMDIDADRWRAAHSTVGVQKLVSQGDEPLPVPDGVVEAIRGLETSDGTVNLKTVFTPGDKVVVTEGPFMDKIGLMQSVRDDQRVVILLSLLGRDTPVRLKSGDIQRAV